MKKGIRISLDHNWIFGAMLVMAAFAAYHPAWNGKPILDDISNLHIARITNEPLGILTKPGIMFSYDIPRYPVTFSFFWLENRLWGDWMPGFHLVNILLHLCSGFLLLLILRRLAAPGAWLAVAIWVLHPVQVESVAWITELKNMLSTVFFLGSCLAYLKFDSYRKRRYYAFALALFVIGMESKAAIIPLPAALLAVIWWRRKRLSWKRDFLPLIPFFVAGIVSAAGTIWLERTYYGARGNGFSYSLLERGLIAGRAFWFYLSKLFWPSDLGIMYPLWNPDQALWRNYAFPAGVLLTGTVLWMLRHRWRALFAAFMYFGVMIFPVLGFFNISAFTFSFVADRWQYTACIGPIVLFSAGLFAITAAQGKKIRFLIQTTAGTVLLLLAGLTWKQSGIYVNGETLYRTVIGRNPACGLAYNGLADNLYKQGKESEALVYVQKAIALHYDEAYYNLGVILLNSGKTGEALAAFQKGTECNGYGVQCYELVARLMQQSGNVDGAIANYRKAVRLHPMIAQFWNGLGEVLLSAGRNNEALVYFRKALEINPDYFDACKNIANVMQGEGNGSEAVFFYRRALLIAPQSFEANYQLGVTLLKIGRSADAIAFFEQARNIQPQSAVCEENLGMAYLQMGRSADAAGHVQRAIAANPADPYAFADMAFVYDQMRNAPAAIQSARQAFQLAEHAGDTAFAARIQQQINIFQSEEQR